jgi:hypothetical protein
MIWKESRQTARITAFNADVRTGDPSTFGPKFDGFLRNCHAMDLPVQNYESLFVTTCV